VRGAADSAKRASLVQRSINFRSKKFKRYAPQSYKFRWSIRAVTENKNIEIIDREWDYEREKPER